MASAKNSGDSAKSTGAAGKPVVFHDVNAPMDEEGRVHHLHVKRGDVANRVLSVGDVGRAERIAAFLVDKRTVPSSRGFVTHTGLYKGVPVSIIATGMGTPMIDFIIRESRVVVDGPMAILRYGTCGGLSGTEVGTVVVTGNGAVLIQRDPDMVGKALESTAPHTGAGSMPAVHPDAASGATVAPIPEFPYRVSAIVKPDPVLAGLYEKHLRECIEKPSAGRFPVAVGIGASADSFYSSQGRVNNFFVDNNEHLLDVVEATLPGLRCLEMETFHLLDLARASKPHSAIHACGAHIVIANRRSDTVVSVEDIHQLEADGGRAALEALVEFQL